MEMVKTKIVSVLAPAVLLCSCSSSPEFTWTKYDMDGHRTGVSAPMADNVAEAIGTINDSSYLSPNGRVFPVGSATYAVAAELIEVQPEMAPLKEVIGWSAKEMRRGGPNSELSNWIVDRMLVDVERICGRKVDVSIINAGGIRVDMPEGTVIKDDLVSMLPFRNYLCYVGLKGSDLVALFDGMAATHVQPFGGARLVIDGHNIDTLLVGGKPVDPERIYGVATIDFLLDGGDRLNVGKNAQELIISDVKVIDAMLPYAMSYRERGDTIKYFTDDRLVVKGREMR